jgi:hypothetical protein
LNVSSSYLQSGIKRLSDFPLPFWLALFVEGTRFTQVKLLAAQEYATSTGLPVPRNVLIPRTKVKYNSCILYLPSSFTLTLIDWKLCCMGYSMCNLHILVKLSRIIDEIRSVLL